MISVTPLFPFKKGDLSLYDWLERITAYYPLPAVEWIRKSCLFTQQNGQHLGQSLEMANYLLSIKSDYETLCAALLFPTLIDSDLTIQDIQEQFTPSLAKLLQGVKNMHAIEAMGNLNTPHHVLIENLREMLLSMVEDVRVVIVKLSERLYTIQNLSHLEPLAQHKLAQETLTIYASLANRLGLYDFKWQLEDFAFRCLKPTYYQEISKQMNKRRADREKNIHEFIRSLSEPLTQAHIQHEIKGRVKHFYSIYKKMKQKNLDYNKIYDIMAARILVNTVEACYACLGIVHQLWQPVPEEFNDYIAVPKPNGYRSIHTVVLTLDKKPIEIQIRTHKMHEFNETGFAAHWAYKENKTTATHSPKIAWLRQVLEWQKEFTQEALPVELSKEVIHDRIFVFTPKGDPISLAQGATPLDFAYHLHTEIGHRCRGAKVNDSMVPLTSTLKTGDQVDIIVSKESKPSRDWLNPHNHYLKTTRARTKVQAWFKKLDYDQHLAEGEAILEHELKRLALKNLNLESLAKQFHLKTKEELYIALGAGDIHTAQLSQALTPKNTEIGIKTVPAIESVPITKKGASPRPRLQIEVEGMKDISTHIAGCCKPLPNDPIVGYLTREHTVSIHHTRCPELIQQKKMQAQHLMQVKWQTQLDNLYPVDLVVEALESHELASHLTQILAEEKVSLLNLKIQPNAKKMVSKIYLTIALTHLEQLGRITHRFLQYDTVYEVHKV